MMILNILVRSEFEDIGDNFVWESRVNSGELIITCSNVSYLAIYCVGDGVVTNFSFVEIFYGSKKGRDKLQNINLTSGALVEKDEPRVTLWWF